VYSFIQNRTKNVENTSRISHMPYTEGARLRPGTHYPHVTWAHVMLTRAVGMWEAI